MGKTIDKIFGKIKKDKTDQEDSKEETTHVPPVSSVVPPTVYLKALSLHSLEEMDAIKSELKSGNILIIRVSPLAEKNIDDVKRAVGELTEFTALIGGDVARLGEERVVVTPSFVKIWREKPPAPEVQTSTEA